MGQRGEVGAVAVALHLGGDPEQRFGADPALAEGDLLDASDLETLPLLDGLNEV